MILTPSIILHPVEVKRGQGEGQSHGLSYLRRAALARCVAERDVDDQTGPDAGSVGVHEEGGPAGQADSVVGRVAGHAAAAEGVAGTGSARA